MRDNIKPVEAGFFKYCMRNLSHERNSNIREYNVAQIRDGKTMYDLMNEYSKANNIPFKVICYIAVNKWVHLFEWTSDMSGYFKPLNFPIEYIMLIPRRVLRKVPVFGMIMISTKAVDYEAVFTFKTKANKLKYIGEINETRIDYWYRINYNKEKYKSALRHINEMVDESIPYDKDFLIGYVRYIMNSYNIDNFKDNNHIINDTVCTLKKFIVFANENADAGRDTYFVSYGNFIDEVSDFVDNIFKEKKKCK